MNLRHAAALALVGWYLMVPPLDQDGRFLVNAPISQWKTTRAFDSATQCEKWLNDYRDEAKADGAKMIQAWADAKKAGRKQTDSELQDFEKNLVISVGLEETKCIASDDPRLKEK